MKEDFGNSDVFRELKLAIQDLCESCLPCPFSVAQKPCKEAADRIFKQLNSDGFRPSYEEVKQALMDQMWDEKNADHLVKKYKRYFTDD
ncbi:MAG: hypothetical protein PF482_15620 [Desulfobacteraceae bacterium]|jgi:hypothetical protein|nr:hypothetical protein [Desulfobacteraceae bacterium]